MNMSPSVWSFLRCHKKEMRKLSINRLIFHSEKRRGFQEMDRQSSACDHSWVGISSLCNFSSHKLASVLSNRRLHLFSLYLQPFLGVSCCAMNDFCCMTQWYSLKGLRRFIKASVIKQQWEGAGCNDIVKWREWSVGSSVMWTVPFFLFFFLPCVAALASRHAPVAAKLLKTEPCPYMVITERSATSFCLAYSECGARAPPSGWARELPLVNRKWKPNGRRLEC